MSDAGNGSGGGTGRASASGIGIAAENPYYFTYGGEPTVLLGASSEDNLFQVPGVEHELDRLAAAGGNYVRNTMSSRDRGNRWPFYEEGGVYNLDRFDPEYWDRLDAFLAATAARDIVVQIEVWATFDFYREPWTRSPFNPANNAAYTAAESGLPTAVDSHPVETENDFFRSPPAAMDLNTVRAYQERFVDRLLESTLEYDHVLYCLDNETSVTPEWGAYWADYIRAGAAEADEEVLLTEMWDPWDLSDPMHDNTFEHPERYDFCDMSQNNHNSGETHYENALRQRERIADEPRPLTNVKVYGGYGDYGSERDAVERFWRNVFAGLASARFHRPPSGIGLGARAERMLRSARAVTDDLPLTEMAPHPDLLADREPNEAYCLADLGRVVAVYAPDGGRVTLLTDRSDLICRWYDVEACGWGGRERGLGPDPTLEPPTAGQWVGVLR